MDKGYKELVRMAQETIEKWDQKESGRGGKKKREKSRESDHAARILESYFV